MALYLPGGETHKRLGPLEAMAEDMVGRGADRSSLVIAFGGGIVNDMAGFLAAIFMRGIPVLQVPPTLLAQVDAAIGGKTGVNIPEGKNLVGAFWQPAAVLCDTEVLESLPPREYQSGLGELAKYAFLGAEGLADLPLAERVARLRTADVRGQLLAEGPGTDNAVAVALMSRWADMFPLGDPPDYEPPPERSVAATASRLRSSGASPNSRAGMCRPNRVSVWTPAARSSSDRMLESVSEWQ